MTSAARGVTETGAPGACRFPLTVIPRCWRFARTQRAESFAQSIAALRDHKLEPSEARPLIPQIQTHIEQWHELKAQVEAASKSNVRAIKSA